MFKLSLARKISIDAIMKEEQFYELALLASEDTLSSAAAIAQEMRQEIEKQASISLLE